MATMIQDDRPIVGLYGPNEVWRMVVGNEVDKILPYVEEDDSPWFEVYVGGEIAHRINARHVETVSYIAPKD